MTDAMREALAQRVVELERELETERGYRQAVERSEEMLEERLHEAEHERDRLEQSYHLLASEMVYEGNSVQHWQQKAKAYKSCAGAVYELKQLTGSEAPDEVVETVQALAAQLERISEAFDESMELHREACAQDGEWPQELAYAAEVWMAQDAPTTSLASRDAAAYEAGYIDGWDHRTGTKPEDGDYRACGRRLARSLAEVKYRQSSETNND